jgi:hypothetical protein
MIGAIIALAIIGSHVGGFLLQLQAAIVCTNSILEYFAGATHHFFGSNMFFKYCVMASLTKKIHE